ncbi:MAG: T9SS type A sorting domain-containing protein [Bacteroidia bacterium]|nr:T9SS type A sorting domain-containing protein [Bacteroidia bacterium]MBP7713173.1 T9SS type A sorting domain-containing protein [Bacteroidia bacterium]MBP8667278.1 T9SS type A sorting domain-containing protein [Bacteroidia bacterium]QQR94114.1 MAG: T9SS type A sorting domain-containing protein [Bacteroidota bacterium]HQX69033.1 T9SS type A sorting domain-containing protein [Bacteroidia bacterium]
MIKRLLTIAFAVLTTNVFSQVLVSYDFTGYDGLVTSIPAGWTITNNDTTAVGKTFYNTPTYCGISCNSYKFNVTGATIISPSFSNATHLKFYMKGNGNTQQPNPFKIYTTADGTNWNNIQTYNPVSQTGAFYTLSLNTTDIQVKFEYIKDSLGFNVGLDDITISNGPVGISNIEQGVLNIYPTVTTGNINLESSNERKAISIAVINMIGKEVKRLNFIQNNGKTILNLSELPDGVYVLKINMNGQAINKRIVIRR